MVKTKESKRMEPAMPYYKKLIGKKCYLSPVCLEDAERLAQWDNDMEVAIPMGDETYLIFSPDKEKEAISEVIKRQDPAFTIVDIKTDLPIGKCQLFAVDKVDRMAMFGIGIGEKSYWNKGYGEEATRLILDYGFNLLNLNSIMLGVFSYNKRAINCYKKIGFKEIGKRRQARIICGKKYDIVLMDILAEEFESVYVKKILDKQGK
jgi:RimJ/RimL family protein N-acetyltransferase